MHVGFQQEMDAELDKLIAAQWGFLHQDWPVVTRTKPNRTGPIWGYVFKKYKK